MRLVLAAALVLALTGCMGGATEQEAPGRAQAAAPLEERFDVLRVLADPGLDYLDPALAYTTQSWALLWNVYLPLLTYRHEPGHGGADLVPALAEELPAISDDGLSYRFTLREGLAYSDGRPVRAGDFARALERVREMDSPGAPLFAAVAEVETDDGHRTVEFRLSRTQADFARVLATTFAAPVPAGTEGVEQAETPVPATGPYRIERYDPGRGALLVRNPEFVPAAGVPPANADRVDVEVVGDAATAARRVLEGEADYLFHSVTSRVNEGSSESARLSTPPSTSYFFLNTQMPPFDRVEVRRAVAFAIDRGELAARLGGTARPTQNLLPPASPAYRRVTVYRRDVERARELVAEAGAVGARVTVWSTSADAIATPARYLVAVLDEIGLDARLQSVPAPEYFTRVADPRSKPQAGAATWIEDYPHPLNWFRALLHGDRIDEPLNTNLSRADVPDLNERIDELSRQTVLTESVRDQWAELDRRVVEEALVVPFANRRLVELFAERIDVDRCWVEHPVYRLDLARLCLEPSG